MITDDQTIQWTQTDNSKAMVLSSDVAKQQNRITSKDEMSIMTQFQMGDEEFQKNRAC